MSPAPPPPGGAVWDNFLLNLCDLAIPAGMHGVGSVLIYIIQTHKKDKNEDKLADYQDVMLVAPGPFVRARDARGTGSGAGRQGQVVHV